jgi:hypothetical protein
MMKLIGEGVKKFELTGEEGLSEILGRARINEDRVIFHDNALPGINRHFQQAHKIRQLRRRKVLQEIASEVPFSYQSDDLHIAMYSLVGEYIAAEIGRDYDRIHPEMFDLNRKISYEVGESYRRQKER